MQRETARIPAGSAENGKKLAHRIKNRNCKPLANVWPASLILSVNAARAKPTPNVPARLMIKMYKPNPGLAKGSLPRKVVISQAEVRQSNPVQTRIVVTRETRLANFEAGLRESCSSGPCFCSSRVLDPMDHSGLPRDK